MKGVYIKPDGDKVEVIDFDEVNKLVHVKFERGKPEYYHEKEYLEWKQECGTEEVPEQLSEVSESVSVDLPDDLILETEEQPKKKRIYKKKEK